MKSVKITAKQLKQLNRRIPKGKSIACKPRESTSVISEYTSSISYPKDR